MPINGEVHKIRPKEAMNERQMTLDATAIYGIYDYLRLDEDKVAEREKSLAMAKE